MIRVTRYRLLLAGALAAVAAGAVMASQARHPRFQELVKAFPEPSDTRGFRYNGKLYAGDQFMGTFRFSARVVESNGEKAWELIDSVQSGEGENELRQTHTSLMSRRFEPISGRIEVFAGTLSSIFTWERRGDEIVIVAEMTGRDPISTRGRFPGSTLSGISSTLLFARLTLPMDEMFSAPVWDVTQLNEEGTPPRPVALRCSRMSDVLQRIKGVVEDAQFTYDFDGSAGFLGGRHKVSGDENDVEYEYRVE